MHWALIVALLDLWIIAFLIRGATGFRRALLHASIILFVIIAVVTEILSVFQAITRTSLVIVWAVLSLALTLYAVWLGRSRFGRVVECGRQIPWRKSSLWLGVIGFILLVTFLVAIIAPPNTWDSMCYHMSRVAHWIQAGSVEFYPTSINRQNYLAPLAEYAILHLQLLSGSDRCANLVQWYSFVLVALIASLIARELKASFKTQLFNAVFCLTVPMAILQSTSTQNDLVVSAWILAFTYYLMRTFEGRSVSDVTFSGLALGLALLTKGTAYLYLLPVGACLCGYYFFRSSSGRQKGIVVARIAGIIVIAAVLNLGYYARSWRLYGRPVYDEKHLVRNDRITAPIVFGNVVRNSYLHLGLPFAGLNRAGNKLASLVLGSELNNPQSTFPTVEFNVRYSLHEGSAGNPLHFVSVVIGLLWVILARFEEKRKLLIYVLGIVGGAALYCVILKWQPWGSRLQTPLFVLAAPVVAVLVGRIRWSWALGLLTFAYFSYSIPYLFANVSRPVIPLVGHSILEDDRVDLMFLNGLDLKEPYLRAADLINNSGENEVGLCVGWNDWEYPLWFLTKSDFAGPPMYRHVGVKDVSQRLGRDGALPRIVVVTRELPDNRIEGVDYVELRRWPPIRVLRKKEE